MSTPENEPIAVELTEFLGLMFEDRPPLIGEGGNNIIAAGGLTLLGGQAGTGKTTLIVDACYHLASGLPWLEFACARPLNILIIENEGPIHLFQKKLAAKNATWKHEIQGSIHIQTRAWNSFSFAHQPHHEAVRQYLDQHQIDLVIGDPIGTLGMEGVGSPEDTREFVQLLELLGLYKTRAFWFPVHFTKEPQRDEINQISGAWGGHLDTLMILKSTPQPDELRLSFPKLRWWAEERPPAPLILGKIRNTMSFERLGEEGAPEMLDGRLIEYMTANPWMTSREIAGKNGIGARHNDVDATLKARTDLFISHPGNEHGRHKNATLWALNNVSQEHTGAHDADKVRDEDELCAPPRTPVRGEGSTHNVPPPPSAPIHQDDIERWQALAEPNGDETLKPATVQTHARRNGDHDVPDALPAVLLEDLFGPDDGPPPMTAAELAALEPDTDPFDAIAGALTAEQLDELDSE